MIILDNEHVEISTPYGPMRTHIFRPVAPGKYPGIVFYSEIFQFTGPVGRMAAMLAGHGYIVAVPEIYSRAAEPGAVASLTLDEFPGQVFHGTVVRNSNFIDLASRTLNVELDVDNTSGKLLPGAYVFVHFKVPMHATTLSVPANALLFRAQGLQVATVNDGKVHLQPVTIGLDQGSTVEISHGLQPTDAVILNPSDSISEGQQVRVMPDAATPAQGTAPGQAVTTKPTGTR